MDIGLVERRPWQWLLACLLAALLLSPPGFAAPVKEERCLDVFADQAYLRRARDLGLAREWIASRAADLSFAVNTAIATDPKVLINPALTGLLKRHAYPGYGGRPWIRLESPARSVSLQHEHSYWESPEWKRADFAATEAGMQFVSTPTRTFLVVQSADWEVWSGVLPEPRRISVYEWRRNRFIYVDAVPYVLRLACSACSSEHLRPSMINYMDVWVFKKTGHLFVTDMAGNSTLVFRPDGRYWGHLLLNGLDRFRKGLRDPAEPEVFPKLCHRGKSLIIRGPRLARVVDDTYAEAVDEVVIGTD